MQDAKMHMWPKVEIQPIQFMHLSYVLKPDEGRKK